MKNLGKTIATAVVTVGLVGGVGFAQSAQAAVADKGASSTQIDSTTNGFHSKLGDPVTNEVLLSWGFDESAIWGWKLESDKPAFDGKTVKQLNWMETKQRLVLLEEGQVYTFTLTNNYTGKKLTTTIAVPVDRRSFDAKADVTGNKVTITWDATKGDAPQGWRIDANKGNLAEHAIVKKNASNDGSVTFSDLKYGTTTMFRVHNPYTLKTQEVKVYVKPMDKQPRATRVVNDVPKPILIDKKGLERDDARAPQATSDVISYMDWNPYNGDWEMTSYTRDPNAAFANGKRFMVQQGKLVK